MAARFHFRPTCPVTDQKIACQEIFLHNKVDFANFNPQTIRR